MKALYFLKENAMKEKMIHKLSIQEFISSNEFIIGENDSQIVISYRTSIEILYGSNLFLKEKGLK